MPKQEKQKKRGFRYGMLLKAIAVFLVLEAGVVLLGVFCCNYDRVKADAENTDKDEANEGCEDGNAPTVNVNVQVSSDTKEKRSRSKKAAE